MWLPINRDRVFFDVGPPGGRVIRRAFRAATRRAPAGRMPVSAVVVVGLGYVGLPLAMRAVAAGHQVTGYDVDPAGSSGWRPGSPT